jgi:hypothetical protein
MAWHSSFQKASPGTIQRSDGGGDVPEGENEDEDASSRQSLSTLPGERDEDEQSSSDSDEREEPPVIPASGETRLEGMTFISLQLNADRLIKLISGGITVKYPLSSIEKCWRKHHEHPSTFTEAQELSKGDNALSLIVKAFIDTLIEEGVDDGQAPKEGHHPPVANKDQLATPPMMPLTANFRQVERRLTASQVMPGQPLSFE